MTREPNSAEPDHYLLERAGVALRDAGFTPEEGVLVALSGGADSVAMFLLLLEASRSGRIPLRLSAAHLHHGLRGAEADEDLEFVRTLAREAGVPLFVGRADVEAHARKEKTGIEEAGRFARYGFLLSQARRTGARFVATGHTRDDQAETVLFRLRRGAGLRGIAGILPVFPLDPEGGILAVRPLLSTTREEITAFLRARTVGWREDSSNSDLRFARNRIRHRLLPFLRASHPGIDALLASLAEASWALRKRESGAPEARADRTGEGGVFVSREEFLGSGPDFSSSIRRGFRGAGGIPQRLRRPHYRNLESMLRGEGPARVDLPGSIPAEAFEGGIWLGRCPEEAPSGIPEVELPVPGSVRTQGYEISARFEAPFELDPASVKGVRASEFIDASAVRFPLRLRSRIAGDRFHPLGAPGRKRLKEYMRAVGIPAGARDARPLVTDGS